MAAVLGAVRHEGLDAVLDAEGLAGLVLAGLQGDGAGRRGRELEGEGVRVRAELLEQLVLHGRQLLPVVVVRRWHDLLPRQDDLLAELDAHHLVLLATIPVCRRHLEPRRISEQSPAVTTGVSTPEPRRLNHAHRESSIRFSVAESLPCQRPLACPYILRPLR